MADENLDLDDDLENDDEDSGGGTNAETPPAIGDQQDGSVVVEVEEDTAQGQDKNTETPPEEDEDVKAKREARRQERLEKKQRQKEREERMRLEIEQERTARRQLEERLAVIERRNTSGEVAQLDHAMNQCKQANNYYKEQIRLGQESNNGTLVADATEKMLLAQQRFRELDNVKRAFLQRQSQPAPLDTRVVNNANQFMQKHTWYRPDGSDMDSGITRTIDNQLAAEGWDPATPQYWQELENRVKKYLPHRAARGTVTTNDTSNQGQGGNAKPKSVVAGSGREGQASSSTKNTFRLSPERVAAMKDAGVWDDPKKRADAIKRFREYDKTSKGTK